MGTGIIVCGLNGAGKSTLGKALAEKMDFHFIDIEDLYFPKTSPDYLYDSPRTFDEVKELLLKELCSHERVVLASVKGDFGEEISAFFQYAVLIDVSKCVRIKRVRNRSFQKFGDRMLPGGDLYEQEERFFDFVESRDVNTVEAWVQTLTCSVIRADGTKPIADNVNLILEHIHKQPEEDGGREAV